MATGMPSFWRDDALPFLELRSVARGHGVCYTRHAHETFSIGAITEGSTRYLNGRVSQLVGPGTVVLMNPGDMHACNPTDAQAWSYSMLHVDATWLACIQDELGYSVDGRFRPFAETATTALFGGLQALHAVLVDDGASQLEKQGAAIGFFSGMLASLAPGQVAAPAADPRLARAAEFINDNFSLDLSLAEISAAAGLSPAHFIRSFKRRFGMTPHAYLVNRRIQVGRSQLKRGLPIAEVASNAGFADQAHFQRAFKRHVAATPGQYRRALAPAGR